MAPPRKPRHHSGYTSEELSQVRAACLTLAVTLGAYAKDVCLVGGIVPTLLVDNARVGDDLGERHIGTNDLDVGLALGLLDDERYAEISARLRAEGFEPDRNTAGNQTVQRWRLGSLGVTIDFLIPPLPDHDGRVRVQNLEGDFGALVTPGLQLAFDESLSVELDGRTLKGERARRPVRVCGPAAFVVLKGLAFADRGEPKDAYDLVYVICHTSGRGEAIADRLTRHSKGHRAVVTRALDLLARDFDGPDGIGPRRAAEFTAIDPANREEVDDAAADAHGYVDDLLVRCRELGLVPTVAGGPA